MTLRHKDDCFTPRMSSEGIVMCPSGDLDCPACALWKRTSQTDILVERIGGAQLYQFDKPANWDSVRQKIKKAGCDYVSMPRPDGEVTIFTTYQLTDKAGDNVGEPVLGSSVRVVLLESSLAIPSGKRIGISRRWSLRSGRVRAPEDLCESETVWGFTKPIKDILAISAAMGYVLPLVYADGTGRKRWSTASLPPEGSYPMMVWAAEVGRYVIRDAYHPFEAYDPFQAAA